jgi:hypothetical protein
MDLFFGWRKDKKIVPARECCQPGKGYLLNYLYRGITEVPKSIYCNRHQLTGTSHCCIQIRQRLEKVKE